MSMIAAGVYLRTLRDGHKKREPGKWSRAWVAGILHTHESQLVRIENGAQDSRASLVFAFAKLIEADLQELSDFILSETAKPERARAVAEARLKKLIEKATMPERKRVATQIRDLANEVEAGREDLPRS